MSVCMYKIQPIISHDEVLPNPTHNMYRVKPLQGPQGLQDQPQPTESGDLSSLERRQEEILKRLAQLKLDMTNLRTDLSKKAAEAPQVSVTSISSTCPPCPELGESKDVVVYASPQFPPYSLLGLAHVWGSSCPLELRSHIHSSVKEPPSCAAAFNILPSTKPYLRITLVWKNVGPETELIVSPVKHTAIRGETNIMRFLSRIGPSHLSYENDSDLTKVTQVDELLDVCQRLARHRTVKEKQAMVRSLNASLGKSEWLCGRPKISLMDLAAWSVIKQTVNTADLTQALTKWQQNCDSLLL